MRQLIANFAGTIPVLLVFGTIALVLAARELTAESYRKAAIVASLYTMFAITLVALWPHSGINPRKLQLIPFARIFELFSNPDVRYTITLPNLLLFVPFGFLAPLAWPSLNRLAKVAAAAALFSLALEITQFVIGGHESSTNDIILNTAGAVAGYCVMLAVRTAIRSIRQRRS